MSESIPQPDLQILITAGQHLRIEDSFAMVAITILVYDYFLTFPTEVSLIWNRPKTLVSVLFLINRYFAPLAITICFVALFNKDLPEKLCIHFAPFEGAFTLITVVVAEALLILRVTAIYNHSKVIIGSLVSLLIAQLCFMIFVLVHSGPVIIPPSPLTYGCILVADPSIGALLVMWTIPTLVFDVVILTLLVIGLWKRAKLYPDLPLIRLIIRDGVLFFSVNFASTLLWTLLGLVLPSDLKNIWSFPSTVLTNVLIGRITLNLRGDSREYAVQRPSAPFRSPRSVTTFETSEETMADIELKSMFKTPV